MSDKNDMTDNRIGAMSDRNDAAGGVIGAMKTSRPTSASISSIVRSLKTMVTKEIGFSLWRTSYYDHIIRDESDYKRIWQYVDENPARWAKDEYNRENGNANKHNF